MQRHSRIELSRLSRRAMGLRCLYLARSDANKVVFPAKVFRNEMAFGIGGQKAAIKFLWDIEKTVNRSPNELDFERMDGPAIADARDIGGYDRLTFDV